MEIYGPRTLLWLLFFVCFFLHVTGRRPPRPNTGSRGQVSFPRSDGIDSPRGYSWGNSGSSIDVGTSIRNSAFDYYRQQLEKFRTPGGQFPQSRPFSGNSITNELRFLVIVRALNSSKNGSIHDLAEKYASNITFEEGDQEWQQIWGSIEKDLLEIINSTDQENSTDRENAILKAVQSYKVQPEPPKSDAPRRKNTFGIPENNDQMNVDQEENGMNNRLIHAVIFIASLTGFIIILIIIILLFLRYRARRFRRNIDSRQLAIKNHLDNGFFSISYQLNPDILMCKCLFKPINASARILGPDFDLKSTILGRVKHKNIVRMYGICESFKLDRHTKTSTGAIFECMDMGNSGDFVKNHCNFSKSPQSIPHSLETVVAILSNVTEAFKYLERQKIVHRNLTSKTVLLQTKIEANSHDVLAKVADFGSARMATKKTAVSGRNIWIYMGSKREEINQGIMAPEVKKNRIFSTLSDVYAFGVLIVECITWMTTCDRYGDQISLSDQSSSESDCSGCEISDIRRIAYANREETILGIIDDLGDLKDSCIRAQESDAWKSIAQLINLAEKCTKSEMHERITFGKLSTEFRKLMKNCRESLEKSPRRDIAAIYGDSRGKSTDSWV